MAHTLSLPAPGKLNLFLHITSRRRDGLHNIQTIYQFIEYGDQLQFTVRTDKIITLHTNVPDIRNEDNLVWQAAHLLQYYTDCPLGADIVLHKNLPVGSGLGGGSSDAATTLLALNQLWEIKLTAETIQKLARQLGADVPLFTAGHAAWGEGIGDRLQPLTLPAKWYVIVCPECHISTAAMYADEALERNSPPITLTDFMNGKSTNCFEVIARKRYPVVDDLLNYLSTYAPARLTGTGGCIFAAFDNRETAYDALNNMPPRTTAFMSKGCNTSTALCHVQQ